MADEAQLTFLFDTDSNASSGCAVPTKDGSFAGTELKLVATVDLATRRVTQEALSDCANSGTNTFGAPTLITSPLATPWNIALGNGQSQTELIEAYIPLVRLPGSGSIRIGLNLASSAGSDALITQSGAPITVVLGTTAVPAGSPALLLMLAGAFLWIAVRFTRSGRRRNYALSLGLCFAAQSFPWVARAALGDGVLKQWGSLPQTAGDATGDGTPTLDIRALFATKDAAQGVLFLRVDAVAFPDIDADHIDDTWETTYFGNLSRDGTGDFDADGMPDRTEYVNYLLPNVDDAFDDADGDRYPNVFEYVKASNLRLATSMPTPDQLVNPAAAGASTTDNIHENLWTALTAADQSGGAYQIVGVRPGVYTGIDNCDIPVASNGPKLLIIGLNGAASTILDGRTTARAEISFERRFALSSLTLRSMHGNAAVRAMNAGASGSRLFDMIVLGDPATTFFQGPIAASFSVRRFEIVGSTILNNHGADDYSRALYVSSNSEVTLRNTILWNPAVVSELYKDANSTVSATFSLVRGDVIAGANNVTGVSAPELRADGHLISGSPLIGRGSAAFGSRFDMDLEVRALSVPDIGADQWKDADADGFEDSWELAEAGSLAALTATGDYDADGLLDRDEYLLRSDPTDVDTDGDTLRDGAEVMLGLNPIIPDGQQLSGDRNQDGLDDAIGFELGFDIADSDVDDDGVSNAAELTRGLDPLNADTDSDGTADGADAFPLDPALRALSPVPGDTQAPVVQLLEPLNAQLQ